MSFVALVVDGASYPHVHIASLKRDGEVLDGKNSGRTQAGTMVRDIIGTYYNYTMQIDADGASLEEYDRLYDVLTSPQTSHTIKVPYGQDTITFDAYVASVSDELRSVRGSGQRWVGMSVKFVGMRPYRRV